MQSVGSKVMCLGVVLIASLVVCVGSPAIAAVQADLVYTVWGETGWDVFGCDVAGIGDVNADTVPDFAVGAYGGGGGPGVVHLYSGADGSLITSIEGGLAAGDRFGFSVDGGMDIDNDGNSDIVIGASRYHVGALADAGQASVYSGDGTLLTTHGGIAANESLGYSVAVVGDLNADSHAEYLVGAPTKYTAAGRVVLYSGVDHSVMHEFAGDQDKMLLGTSVASAGDVDDDGVTDIVIGAENYNLDGEVANGKAIVISGDTFATLYEFVGVDNAHFSYSVDSAGDVNNDGYGDVIVGAPLETYDGAVKTGSVSLFSGVDGSQLWKKYGSDFDDEGDAEVQLGWSVCGFWDVDGDGKNDVLVGAPYADPNGRTTAGAVYLLSGADGSLLLKIEATSMTDRLGYALDTVGDINGDGKDEFVVGAMDSSTSGDQYAHVYSIQYAGPPADCAQVHQQDHGLSADLNNDCYVEWADFGIFAAQWQECNDPADTSCTTTW